jgi:enoyl-CoA hydratase
MAIVRCVKCHIVVLDSTQSGQKDVICNECGSRYRINIDAEKVIGLYYIDPKGKLEELRIEKDIIKLDTVIYRKSGKIARIILNQPKEKNILNANMKADIIQCIGLLENDDDVVVGIIKGNGNVFCAGSEPPRYDARYGISKRADGSTRRPSQRARLWLGKDDLKFISRVRRCSKPLICQAHGACFDEGVELSAVCDITIAAEDCQFGHPNVEQRQRFGGMIGMNGLNEVLLIGPKKTRELLLLGNIINGKEAENIGLVNHAVPLKQLESVVEKMASEIASIPRDALYIGKTGTILTLNNLEPSPMQSVVMRALASNIRIEPSEQGGNK